MHWRSNQRNIKNLLLLKIFGRTDNCPSDSLFLRHGESLRRRSWNYSLFGLPGRGEGGQGVSPLSSRYVLITMRSLALITMKFQTWRSTFCSSLSVLRHVFLRHWLSTLDSSPSCPIVTVVKAYNSILYKMSRDDLEVSKVQMYKCWRSFRLPRLPHNSFITVSCSTLLGNEIWHQRKWVMP